MAQTYDSYQVFGPQPACSENQGLYYTLDEARAAAQADARWDAADDAARGIQTNAWSGRTYEIRAYDGRGWHHIEDFEPRPAAEVK